MKLLHRSVSQRSTKADHNDRSDDIWLTPSVDRDLRRPWQTDQLDAVPRLRKVNTARPQTADNGIRHSKLTRMSFFEAFAIDAGQDTFAFPKPSSAQTTPEAVQLLTPSTPPMIGLAFGSPSNPPQSWASPTFPVSANTTPRTARFIEALDDEPLESIHAAPDFRLRSTPAWKRVGNLFRRATRTGRYEIENSTTRQHEPRCVESTTCYQRERGAIENTTQGQHEPKGFENITHRQQEPRNAQLTTSNSSQRPKSRGRMTISRDRKTKEILDNRRLVDSKVDLSIDRVFRYTERELDETARRPATSHTQSMKLSKVSRLFGTNGAILPAMPARQYDNTAPLRTTSSPAPRLELQLPSYQLERYSVMFEKVLDPKPSLLERRKSRLRLFDTNIEECAADKHVLSRTATLPASQTSTLDRDSHIHSHNKLLPPLQRSHTTPLLRVSPLQTEFPTQIMKSQEIRTFYDSPVSAEDEISLPRTPPYTDVKHSVRVFTESNAHLGASHVWHSMLPATPGSSTSSRFSIDVHKAVDSPVLLSRSRTFNGSDNMPRPIARQVQVAVARKVSMSQLLNSAHLDGSANASLKPKIVQVKMQALSRKSSMLDTKEKLRHMLQR